MISSIFDKRKPVNFIIITAYLFLYVIISQYFLFNTEVSFLTILFNFWTLALLIITVFGVDFLDRKHNLSKHNAYVMLLFTISLSLFPQIFMAENIILTHIFILLATGKLLSLSNELIVKQKIFDAALWVCVAALFYPWAVLYFIAVYMAIILYSPKNYKNWGIPLISLITVFILRYTYFLWFQNGAGFSSIFQFKVQWQYLKYSLTNYFLPFAFLAVMGFLATFTYGIRAVRKRTLQQSTGFLIIIALLIGVSMALFFGNEHKTTLIFMVFPLTVLFANYLERIKKKWIKESVLWIFLLAPVVVLMLQFSAVR